MLASIAHAVQKPSDSSNYFQALSEVVLKLLESVICSCNRSRLISVLNRNLFFFPRIVYHEAHFPPRTAPLHRHGDRYVRKELTENSNRFAAVFLLI